MQPFGGNPARDAVPLNGCARRPVYGETLAKFRPVPYIPPGIRASSTIAIGQRHQRVQKVVKAHAHPQIGPQARRTVSIAA